MPMNNPWGYTPQFTPTNIQSGPQMPQIPQLNFGGMPGLQTDFQLPSLGGLIQPQQPGGSFDLMGALQQSQQQVQGAREMASQMPKPPKPVNPVEDAKNKKKPIGLQFIEQLTSKNKRSRISGSNK